MYAYYGAFREDEAGNVTMIANILVKDNFNEDEKVLAFAQYPDAVIMTLVQARQGTGTYPNCSTPREKRIKAKKYGDAYSAFIDAQDAQEEDA